MNRRRLPAYWLARMTSNGGAMLVLYGASGVAGIGYSWRLWLVAFAYYSILTIGDAIIDSLWPQAGDSV